MSIKSEKNDQESKIAYEGKRKDRKHRQRTLEKQRLLQKLAIEKEKMRIHGFCDSFFREKINVTV